nr:hypothetical protein [Tanacetum cinerariifolium]
MAKLAFGDYHNMVAILEKTEHNTDFHQMVDILEASHIRIETTNQGAKILATIDGKPRTVSESSLRRHLKLSDEEGISSLPKIELFENLSQMGYKILPNQRYTFQKGQFSHQWKFLIHTIMQCLSPKSTGFNEFRSNIATAVEHHSPQHDSLPPSHPTTASKHIPQSPTEPITLRKYTRRAQRIAQSKAISPAVDEPAFVLRDDRQGKAFPTVSSLDAGQDRENIIKTSALPHESSPRVTSLDTDEGSMQQKLQELMEFCTSLQRQQSQMAAKIKDQDLEISSLKARVKFLEDKDRGSAEPTQEDAPIKRGIMEICNTSILVNIAAEANLGIIKEQSIAVYKGYKGGGMEMMCGGYEIRCGGLGSRFDVLDGVGRCHGCFGLKWSHVLSFLAKEVLKQDRENINKTSALPHESSPRVTSLDADEGSMQQKLQELMDLCTGLQRQQTQMDAKIKAQDLEISGLKARVKLLEDKDRGSAEPSQEDAPIKGRSMEIGEEVGVDKTTELGSNDTEEMVNVLSSLEAANILTNGVAAVSVSPVAAATTVGVSTVGVPTVS